MNIKTLIKDISLFNFNYDKNTLDIDAFMHEVSNFSDKINHKDQFGTCLMGTLNLGLLKYIHSLGGDINATTNTKGMIMSLLGQSFYWGKPDISEYLLKNGALLENSNGDGNALTEMADTICQNTKCLDVLKKYNDPTTWINEKYMFCREEQDLLSISINSGNYIVSLWLLRNGFKVNNPASILNKLTGSSYQSNESGYEDLLSELKSLSH
jgi:hypothetical protein